jgi:hypothetical protein
MLQTVQCEGKAAMARMASREGLGRTALTGVTANGLLALGSLSVIESERPARDNGTLRDAREVRAEGRR